MITVKEIISIVNREFPKRSVTAITMYKSDFLVCAPEKGFGDDDFSDPYFIISSTDGSIKQFLPTSDISGFNKAIRGKLLYEQSNRR